MHREQNHMNWLFRWLITNSYYCEKWLGSKELNNVCKDWGDKKWAVLILWSIFVWGQKWWHHHTIGKLRLSYYTGIHILVHFEGIHSSHNGVSLFSQWLCTQYFFIQVLHSGGTNYTMFFKKRGRNHMMINVFSNDCKFFSLIKFEVLQESQLDIHFLLACINFSFCFLLLVHFKIPFLDCWIFNFLTQKGTLKLMIENWRVFITFYPRPNVFSGLGYIWTKSL